MAGQQQAPQRKQLPFDDQRMKLYANPVQGATKRPTLTFGYVTRKFVANMASITVRTQVPNDKNNGVIKAEIPMSSMYSIFETVKEILALPGAQERSRRLYTDFLMGKKTDQPVPYANLIVGKEEDGRVYIALVAKNRPNIKFHVAPDDFIREVTRDGQEMNTVEYYAQYGRGYFGLIADVYAWVVNSEFIGWSPDNGGGNGGNGGNGGGNNWGGGNNGGNGGGNNNGGGNSGWGGGNDSNDSGDDLWV